MRVLQTIGGIEFTDSEIVKVRNRVVVEKSVGIKMKKGISISLNMLKNWQKNHTTTENTC